MKGTRRKNAHRRKRLHYLDAENVEFVQRKLTLPTELDAFLTTYARRKGFNSEVQAVYQMIRDHKDAFEQAPA